MEENNKSKESIAEDVGLFAKFFNFLVGKNINPQMPALKAIHKQLTKAGYKYYNLKKEKILPDFVRLIYRVYESVAPLREFFLLRNEESFYEDVVIHAFMSEEQLKMEDYLTETSITEASKRLSFNDLQQNCSKAFANLKKEFSTERIDRITAMNSALVILRHFCVFDFYAFLRKFCFDLRENNFTDKPKFSAMSRDYFEAPIFDLLNNIENIISVDDWSEQIEFISHISGYKEFETQKFYATVDFLRKLHSAEIFSKFAKLFFRDPKYELVVSVASKNIITPYIENQQQKLKSIISDVYAIKRSERIESIKETLFGDISIVPLKNYNEEFSENLEVAKSPSVYTLCTHIMYLHNYFISVLQKQVASFVDVFGMRAVADTKYTSQMTSEFHALLELDTEIIRLDNQLGPSFPRGYKIIGMLDNRGKTEILSKLESEVNTVNAEFNNILSKALVLFKLLGDKIQSLLVDANNSSHVLLKNWDALDQYFTTPVIPTLTEISTGIENFVALIDCYN